MKEGVLLVNLGTPDSPSPADIRQFLRRFLSDKRVIKRPDILWLPVLHGIVLRTRPHKVAKHYAQIRMDEGSPLTVYTTAQRDNLRRQLPHAVVETAMSYSKPYIPDVLETMLDAGVRKLTVIPLYPQYSSSTTGSVFDAVAKHFTGSERIIDLRFVASFGEHPAYITYFADRIRQTVRELGLDGVLFSYHNIPQSYVTDGDRYPFECERTTGLIMQQAGDIPHFMAYQSVFGRGLWMLPTTDHLLRTLPQKGVKRLLVAAPGFVADNIETIWELGAEGRETFLRHGGEKYAYLPTFNKDSELAVILKDLLQ
ncbi:MAG: ferrochelatase [Defluviitaleaceae bacterium]|nr:ferrochelatase [Defluviitaleaceae bacterium]